MPGPWLRQDPTPPQGVHLPCKRTQVLPCTKEILQLNATDLPLLIILTSVRVYQQPICRETTNIQAVFCSKDHEYLEDCELEKGCLFGI